MSFHICKYGRACEDCKTFEENCDYLIELEEVRYGHWIEDTYSNGTYDADCSLCGEKIRWNGCMNDFNYCPNCGAKMISEVKNNG